jgi:enoyl-[acyl-carrier protein] reductase I
LLLENKVALILGVANHRSIAWGIARALRREGAGIALTYASDRFEKNVRDLAATLPPDGASLPRDGASDPLILPCDVQKDADIAAVMEGVAARWGKLDILVHSVAFARTEDLGGDFLNISRDGYALAQDVSVYSLLALAREARPLLRAAGGGSVITLSYLAASRVVPRYNVMAMAKAALECEVRYLAAALGPDNVRVNAISAGPIKTLAASAVRGVTELKSVMAEKAPLRRNVSIEEVGDTALFLASDLSRGVTGQVIYVDAGYHAMGV